MKLTISAKLLVGSVINILLVLALAALSFWTIERLRSLQDEGVVVANQATSATEGANLGPEMYQIIADAEINRNLAVTDKDWAAKKIEAQQDIDGLAAAANTDKEKTDIAAVRQALAALEAAFENDMLPILRTTPGLTPQIQELDGKIDEHAAKLASLLTTIRQAMEAEAKAADVNFDVVGRQGTLYNLIIAAVAAILALGIAILLARAIATPVRNMTQVMGVLAAGNTAAEIPARDRHDEIGAMAKAVQVFKDNMIETERLRADQEAAKKRAEAERRKGMLELADKFEAGVGGVVKSVSAAAEELQATAKNLSATAEETSRQSNAVAAASEQMTQNVQTVASATEELSSSIREISNQVTESTRIVGTAVSEAEETNAKVKALSEAASKIGDVVILINQIAGQTNLLALNATIEAARAGEAGKGFAVVASEVKNLATQTAKATEEIGGQVRAIQESTESSAQAIQSISQTINRVNEISTAIASAVEEQGAATQEISRNVQEAATGTTEVSTNITGVTQASQQTSAGSAQVLAAASELAQNGAMLQRQVDEFLREIRAG
jgi:methyl-accepting chemotaxis protein